MDANISDVTANSTLDQVLYYLNISELNQSEVAQIHLLDFYEPYKTIDGEHSMVYRTVACVMGTIIILSNLIVVISSGLILRNGQQHKSTYLLLGNVSLADTIIGISVIFVVTVDLSVSNSLCILQMGMLVCPAMVSIFSVGLIAVDRYIYILHGLYYQRWFNTTRVRMGIIITWIIGIFISMLPAMGWTGRSFKNFRCWYIAVFPSALLLILSTVALSVIIMVCLLYILILRRAVKTADKIKEFRENCYTNKGFIDDFSSTSTIVSVSAYSDNMQMNKMEKETQRSNCSSFGERRTSGCCWVTSANHISKLKAVKTVLIVALCFLGTWAPYFVSVIMYVKCDVMRIGYECNPVQMLTLEPLYLLGCCNSLCDPVIYAWRHSGFKRSLRRLYRRYLRKLEMIRI